MTTECDSIYNIGKSPAKSPEAKNEPKRIFLLNLRKSQSETKPVKYAHRTMGVAKTPLQKPIDFLKKNTRLRVPASTQTVEKRNLCSRKPPVPKSTILPTVKQKEERNFRIENIKFVPKLISHQTKPKIVDTKKGHIMNLNKSGLQPEYVYRKDMGQVPLYIRKRQEEEQETEQAKEQRREEWLQEIWTRNQQRQEEHKKRLEELKAQWASKSKEFLLLPVVTDIPIRVRRRYNLEKELADLEAEIERLTVQDDV